MTSYKLSDSEPLGTMVRLSMWYNSHLFKLGHIAVMLAFLIFISANLIKIAYDSFRVQL